MTTPNSDDNETSRPSVAKYTEQVVFFTDQAQEAALDATVAELREPRAEIMRRVLDLMLPALARDFINGTVRKPYDKGEAFGQQIVFNLEPSQLHVLDTLVRERKGTGRPSESRGTVLREAIARGLPRVRAARGQQSSTDRARAELASRLRAAGTTRPVSNGGNQA
jgi:hypothetical protein